MTSRLSTLAIAAAGAAAFHLLAIPLPFLLGPMAACLLAALAGARMAGMGRFGDAMRTILGVAVGASITPALVGRLPEMLYSVALIPVFVLVIMAIGYPFFRRVCGFDHPTAWYAAAPGGLQDMLVFGEEAGGDVRSLSLIHATRVLAVVSVAPLLLSAVWEADLTAPPGLPARAIPAAEGALMVAAALVGWILGVKARLFGASILGPMIATAALSLSGLIANRPPAEAIWVAQFFIGVAVGVKYAGVTARELRGDVAAGLGYCVVLAALTLVFAEAISRLGLAPPLEAFLAFAPGGQAEMAVLALVAGADVAFVVTHHLLRIVLVITLAPMAARLVKPEGDRP